VSSRFQNASIILSEQKRIIAKKTSNLESIIKIMKTLILAAINVLVSIVSPSVAFAPAPFSLVRETRQVNLNAFAGENYNDDPMAGRTCPHQLLTQRSLQSLMFLMQQMRDPHTVEWLELLSFTNPGQLLSYHGTGALDFRLFPEWDTFLQELIEQPEDILLIEIKSRAQNNGLSKNNPYREKEVRFHSLAYSLYDCSRIFSCVRHDDAIVTHSRTLFHFLSSHSLLIPHSSSLNQGKAIVIEIDIDPVSLAGRMLSVREKLGREWVQDLELLSSINDNILESYHERILEARGVEERAKTDRDEGGDSQYDNSLGDVATDDTSSANFGWQTDKNQSFERGAIYMVVNHPNFNDMDASPLRASNFDLLFLLSTQESIHRLLEEYDREDNDVALEWLLDFYDESIPKYFDGNQRYGRADDFLDDLLRKGPTLKTTEDGNIDIIDPLAIAEDLIRTRGIVAEEWKVMMSCVPEDHTDIRRTIFIKQMAKWGQHVEVPREEKKEEIIETAMSNEYGDFQ
jgi:hypothetical protein